MSEAGRMHVRVAGEQLIATGISDIGLFRKENQDSIHLDENGRFVLLADGMGGHERGAEASRTIIRLLREYLHPERVETEIKDITAVEGVPVEVNCLFSLIDKGIRKTNAVLYEKNRTEGIQKFMGSTLVGFVPSCEYAIWFHVGDSRLYRFRDKSLTQMTKDHSAYADWLRKGGSGLAPGKNLVTRAIGPREGVVPDIGCEKVRKGDLYILCSDGLNDMISDDEISGIIDSGDDVDHIALNLVNAAIEAGGIDNISVIVCRV